MTPFFVTGLADDAGEARGITLSHEVTKTDKGDLEWLRIHVRALRLHSNAHLHLVQGLSLANLLFTSRLVDIADSPLLYLRGRMTDSWIVPCVVHDLVLSHPEKGPEGLTIKEMMTALFLHEMEKVK